jgi:hypothetical protein
LRQGLEVWRAAGAELLARPSHVAGLAEVYGEIGRTEEGLELLAESIAVLGKTGECWWEAELYRLNGELTLKKSGMPGDPYWGANTEAASEAEGCFRKRHRHRPPPEREVARAACRDEPESSAHEAGREGQSAPNARRDLRLVHRGVRHARSGGGESATRRAFGNSTHDTIWGSSRSSRLLNRLKASQMALISAVPRNLDRNSHQGTVEQATR